MYLESYVIPLVLIFIDLGKLQPINENYTIFFIQ